MQIVGEVLDGFVSLQIPGEVLSFKGSGADTW